MRVYVKGHIRPQKKKNVRVKGYNREVKKHRQRGFKLEKNIEAYNSHVLRLHNRYSDIAGLEIFHEGENYLGIWYGQGDSQTASRVASKWKKLFRDKYGVTGTVITNHGLYEDSATSKYTAYVYAKLLQMTKKIDSFSFTNTGGLH